MARVKFISVVKEGRGRMGDVVFSSSRGTPYMKAYKRPSSTNTEKQQAVKKSFSQLVQDWIGTNGILHRSWENHAKGTNMSGYNAFISDNFLNQRDGKPLNLFKAMGEDPVTGFAAQTGNASGEIVCSYSPRAGKYITFFAQKKVDNTGEGQIIRFNGGMAVNSSFTVSGLEAGEEYFVYAVITNDEYDKAVMVSGSTGALAQARA